LFTVYGRSEIQIANPNGCQRLPTVRHRRDFPSDEAAGQVVVGRFWKENELIIARNWQQCIEQQAEEAPERGRVCNRWQVSSGLRRFLKPEGRGGEIDQDDVLRP